MENLNTANMFQFIDNRGLFVFLSRNLSISVAPDKRNLKKLAFLRRSVSQMLNSTRYS